MSHRSRTHRAAFRPARGAAVLATAFAALTLGAPVLSASGVPTLPPAPAVTAAPTPLAGAAPPSPALPGPPAPLAPGSQFAAPQAPCSFAPLGPQEVRTAYYQAQRPSWLNLPTLAVDPSQPCRMYMLAGQPNASNSYWDSYPYTVLRGTVSMNGTAWQPVFQSPIVPEDAVPQPVSSNRAYPPQAFPSVTASGQVWLPDVPPSTGGAAATPGAGETRLFTSSTGGQQWRESDQGLALQDPAANTAQVLWARSDPAVGYLLRESSQSRHMGPPTLSVTTDAGRSWSPRTLPAIEDPANWEGVSPTSATGAGLFGIDPTDSHRIFALSTAVAAPALLTWESDDMGLTWSPHPGSGPLPAAPAPDSLVVAANGRGGADLYYLDDAAGQWYASRDLGSTWTPLPLPATGRPSSESEGFTFLAPDPTDPADLVWVSGSPVPRTYPWGTGGTTTQPEVTTVDIAASRVGFTAPPARTLRLTAAPGLSFFGYSLQPDAAGDFFLALEEGSQDPHYTAQGPGVRPTPSARILAFRPSALTSGTTISLSSPPPPPLPTGPSAAPSLPPESPVVTCPVTAGTGGSVAFDGQFLDYTRDDSSPGVIYRVDASTCTQQPPVLLHAADFPGAVLPSLVGLTYDSRYPLVGGRTGALLASAWSGEDPRVDNRHGPLYAIDPLTGASTLASFAPEGAGCQPDVTVAHCGDSSFLSHDVFNDRLLSLVDGSGNAPAVGWLSPDGSSSGIPCFNSQWAVSAAAATVAGRDVVYALLEDDATLVRLDLNSCQIVGGYRIPAQIEDPGEDEQVACDPLSFPNTPVIWVRDSVAGGAQAYPAPDAYCPFPTTLKYLGPTAATPGVPVDLCFGLTANRDGRSVALPGEPVQVRLGGSAAGTAVTDSSGTACLKAPTTLTGVVQVQGRFAGTYAYLPADAAGSLLLSAVGLPETIRLGLMPPAIPAGLPPPQPVVGPQGYSGAGTESVGSASAQAEAQAQAQSQSQAQAQSVTQVQPGVMTQRQRRTQVAIQEQMGSQTAYQATGLRRAHPAPIVAVTMGMIALGFGLVARRPRWAVVRTRHRRHRDWIA